MSVLKEDREYVLIKHVLAQGEEVNAHYHPGAIEYFLIDKGAVSFFLDNKEIKINCTDGKAELVMVPQNAIHGLVAKSDIRYLVVRTAKTDTVYI